MLRVFTVFIAFTPHDIEIAYDSQTVSTKRYGTPTQSSKLSVLLTISFPLGAQLASLFVGNLADWTSVQIAYSALLGGLVLFAVAVWMIRCKVAHIAIDKIAA